MNKNEKGESEKEPIETRENLERGILRKILSEKEISGRRKSGKEQD